MRYNMILSGCLAAMLIGCAGTKPQPATTAFTQLPGFTVESDHAGKRVLHPVKRGVPNRAISFPTQEIDWQTGVSPGTAMIACYSFYATQASTGAEKCGMKCDDGTWYVMDCGADIFADGFDLRIRE